jgi:hypothetical protein
MFSEETVWGIRQMVPGALVFGLAFVLDSSGIISGNILFPISMACYALALLGSMLYTVHSYKPPFGVKAYSVTGGVFTGSSVWWGTHASWPFARLHVTSEGVTLVAPWRRYEFRRGEFELSRYGYLLKTSIRFEHTNAAYPTIVTFTPKNSVLGLDAFGEELKAMGYAI